MLQMVQNAQEKYDVETAQIFRRNPADIRDHVLDFRIEQVARQQEFRTSRGIERHDVGAPALHLEAEPTVPSANVQNPLSFEIRGNRKLCQPRFEQVDALKPLNPLAIRQFDAVIPAEVVELVDLLSGRT